MSESYQAWDNNEYPWPPPEGWYQAPGGLWWPEGYGPGPAPTEAIDAPAAEQPTMQIPAVEVPPARPTPAAGSYVPPVSVAPPTVAPAPGAPQPAPGAPEPVPAPAPALGAPGMEPAPGAKAKSSRKGLLVVLGLLVGAVLVAVPLYLALGRSDDSGAVATTLPASADLDSTTTTEVLPPAGVGPGSLNEPWAINDPVGVFYDDLDNGGEQARWVVQVTGPAVDSTNAVLAESTSNQVPDEGSIYITIPIRLTYKSGPAPVRISDLQFKGLGPSARVLTESGDSCGSVPDGIDHATELFPGGVVEGNVCWMAPAGDIAGMKLIVEVVAAQGAVYIKASE